VGPLSPDRRPVRRRELIAGLGGVGLVGSAGCLSALGLADRGPVSAKYIRRVTASQTGIILFDSVEGDRQIATAHERQLPASGRIYVSQQLHETLAATYRAVEYRIRHDCCEPSRQALVSRGDFNSLAIGDVATLRYGAPGERATVVGVEKATGDATDTS